MKNTKGFTIVELMVVIIVIAVLATIGGLAWRVARNNAVDSSTRSDVIRLRDAIEKYYRINNEYPFPPACSIIATSSTICNSGELESVLVPEYIQALPLDKNGNHFSYQTVRSPSPNPDSDAYGLRVIMNATTCKTGKNMPSTWWSDTADCDL